MLSFTIQIFVTQLTQVNWSEDKLLHVSFLTHTNFIGRQQSTHECLAQQALTAEKASQRETFDQTRYKNLLRTFAQLTISLTGTSVRLIILRSSSSPSSLSLRLFLAMVPLWRVVAAG